MKKGKALVMAFIFSLICGTSFLAYEFIVYDTITKAGITASIVDMVVVFFGMWWFYSHAKKTNI